MFPHAIQCCLELGIRRGSCGFAGQSNILVSLKVHPSWKSRLRTLISGIRYIQAEDRHSHKGPVAQRLEQGTHNPLVGGSNPSGPTKYSVKK